MPVVCPGGGMLMLQIDRCISLSLPDVNKNKGLAGTAPLTMSLYLLPLFIDTEKDTVSQREMIFGIATRIDLLNYITQTEGGSVKEETE